MTARRRLHLCADDHGLSAAISQGIERLVLAGRLSGVSCITNAAHWPTAAASVRHWPREVEVGLHFNLTEGVPLSAELRRHWPSLPSLPRLLALAHLRLLPLPALHSEWRAQLEAFTQAVGRPPRMVDGHQHVHHLPGVREAVLQGLQALPPGTGVRNTGHVIGQGFSFKRRVIEASGGRALLADLRRHGLPHNAALIGVYDFAEGDHRQRMQRWFAEVPSSGAMLFCHPGERAGSGDADPIAAARLRELTYLESGAFLEDVQAAGLEVGPSWRH